MNVLDFGLFCFGAKALVLDTFGYTYWLGHILDVYVALGKIMNFSKPWSPYY